MTTAEQEKLYTEYRGKVLGYIRSRVNNPSDAEDLCEDVFLKAYRSQDAYNPEKASESTWIYSITRNTVIDYYRRTRPTEEIPEDLSDDSSVEDGVLDAETLDELAAALERLPPELTDIIVLRYYDRLQLTQIVLQLGISYGAVKIRHQKALAMLKSMLENK
ncbi:MAG: sigma-70 family RNA polymerase sigma factor [Clostridia bacterium]|nr:sigma-70 family RNA polymerase sigma factor [Clostridia bacterium]